jgi:hypothetical protein
MCTRESDVPFQATDFANILVQVGHIPRSALVMHVMSFTSMPTTHVHDRVITHKNSLTNIFY